MKCLNLIINLDDYILFIYMFIYIFFNKIKINTITFNIYLYIDKEKYKTLAKVKKIFALQLEDLKDNRIIDDDGIHWPIKFYFSDD